MLPIEELKFALEAIQKETKPIDGHTDPGALTDTWKTIWEHLENIQNDLIEIKRSMYEFVGNGNMHLAKQLELNRWIIPKDGIVDYRGGLSFFSHKDAKYWDRKKELDSLNISKILKVDLLFRAFRIGQISPRSMRYIISDPESGECYYTNWFDEKNHYQEGMVVIDVLDHGYFNGKEWVEMEEDHL